MAVKDERWPSDAMSARTCFWMCTWWGIFLVVCTHLVGGLQMLAYESKRTWHDKTAIVTSRCFISAWSNNLGLMNNADIQNRAQQLRNEQAHRMSCYRWMSQTVNISQNWNCSDQSMCNIHEAARPRRGSARAAWCQNVHRFVKIISFIIKVMELIDWNHSRFLPTLSFLLFSILISFSRFDSVCSTWDVWYTYIDVQYSIFFPVWNIDCS